VTAGGGGGGAAGGPRVSNGWYISVRGKNGVYGTRIWYSSYASVVQSYGRYDNILITSRVISQSNCHVA